MSNEIARLIDNQEIKAEQVKIDIINKYLDALTKMQSVYIFGTQVLGKEVLSLCEENNIHVRGFIDNNTAIQGKIICDKKVFALSQIKTDESSPIIIATLLYCNEIHKQLIKEGYSLIIPYPVLNLWNPKIFPAKFTLNNLHEDVITNFKEYIDTIELLSDNMSKKILSNIIRFRLSLDYNFMEEIREKNYLPYFDKKILKLKDNECFLDGGGYIGDTTLDFISVTKGKYNKVLFFEPDDNLLQQAKENLKEGHDITYYRKGLHSSNMSLKFNVTGNETGKIDEKGRDQIEVIALDKFLNEFPTFIKMDIEGSEKAALEGMKKLIKDNKPKLAISVYHESSDIWYIPKFIQSINSDYKFYLRHYTNSHLDTVLYCV